MACETGVYMYYVQTSIGGNVLILRVRVQGDYKQLSQEYEKNMFESKTVQCLVHGKAEGRTISKAKAHNATSRAAKTQIDSAVFAHGPSSKHEVRAFPTSLQAVQQAASGRPHTHDAPLHPLSTQEA